MYVSGSVFKSRYITDPQEKAVVNPYSVGLSLLSVASIHGGGIDTPSSIRSMTHPLGLRIDERNKKYYDLREGAYHCIFSQGLSRLPKGSIVTLAPTTVTTQLGIQVIPITFFEFNQVGNISTTIVIPFNCPVSLEIGSVFVNIFLQDESFEEV